MINDLKKVRSKLKLLPRSEVVFQIQSRIDDLSKLDDGCSKFSCDLASYVLRHLERIRTENELLSFICSLSLIHNDPEKNSIIIEIGSALLLIETSVDQSLVEG